LNFGDIKTLSRSCAFQNNRVYFKSEVYHQDCYQSGVKRWLGDGSIPGICAGQESDVTEKIAADKWAGDQSDYVLGMALLVSWQIWI